MKRYPAYKDSGIEWIEEVPVNWDLCRFKHCYQSNMGQTILKEDLSFDGQCLVYSATMGNEFFGAINNPQVELKQGDLVIPARGNSIGYVKIVDGYSTCTQTTIYSKRIPSKYTVEARYAYYYLIGKKRDLFDFTRTAIPQITIDQVSNNPFLVPSVAEQGLIITYLDRKTAQIDDLITKKERMIELLKEERMAVINQAVTKGLDPKAEMKDSGTEWLGKIPKHWGLKRLKYLVKLINEKGAINDNSIRVDLENIESWTGQLIKTDTITATDEEMKQFIPGDVLFNKLRPYLAKVFHARQEGICGGELLVLRHSVQIDSKFLYYRAISNDFIRVIDGSTYGTKMPRASWDFIGNLFIPYPSIEEQRRIVDFFERKTSQINMQVAREQKSIDLLKEYRASLISEAVTGKIDVSTTLNTGGRNE